MEGQKLCLVIAIAMFGLGSAVHSRRSFISNRVDYNTLNENNYNKVLTENTDNQDTLNSDRNKLIESFKGKIIVNKFKAYLYKLIDRYENNEGKYDENKINREENEEVALQNEEANDYENNIGNHFHHYDRNNFNNQENVWVNEEQKEKLNPEGGENNDYLDENADDNKVENDEEENTDEEDDSYWQERENFEDNMENRKEKEFGMMDYLVDTNWADEGKALKGVFRNIQRADKMDGDYIPDDYFDNSDYEA